MLQIDAAGAASIALLEHLSRHEHPRATPAQRVSPQRHLIARQYDERDEDVFTQPVGAFSRRHRCRRRNERESVPTKQAHHLPVALRAGEHQGAAHDGNVGKVGGRAKLSSRPHRPSSWIRRSRVLEDTPAVRGMIERVKHLFRVETVG